MIEKLYAAKIMSACIKYDIVGDAYAFGDQLPTFSRDWAVNVWERLGNGLALPDDSDNDRAMSSDEFFKLCGFSSYADIDYNGNAKILLDLGKPLPEEMYARADLLFDGGVIEHIPNIFQAMCNAVMLVKKGGVLIECVPAASFGESFYNIDPLLLRDFYGANGFEMIECLLHYNNVLYYYAVDKSIWRFVIEKTRTWIRPYIPKSVLEYRRRMKEAMSSETSSGIRGMFDNIHELGCLDPFDPEDIWKIQWWGLAPRTHVIYVGIKRSDSKAESIRSPWQEAYPSIL